MGSLGYQKFSRDYYLIFWHTRCVIVTKARKPKSGRIVDAPIQFFIIDAEAMRGHNVTRLCHVSNRFVLYFVYRDRFHFRTSHFEST
jgi:hypothetical protein